MIKDQQEAENRG